MASSSRDPGSTYPTSIKDKTVLITGANSGVGFEAAKDLAFAGARILMVCRDESRGERARARLAELATGPPPELLLADLSSQAEVRNLGEEVRGRCASIDVLLNNAGGVFAKREFTVDGIEKTLATNHLAPFLLTNRQLDLLLAAPSARVVTVATEVYAGKLDFGNLQSERGHQFFKAYQRSKLCNILFAVELARRLEGSGVSSNAVSPGPSKTSFGNNITGAVGVLLRTMKRLPIFGPPEKGARTLVYAASDPALDGVTGKFFYKLREEKTKPITHDPEVAERLWSVSEDLCGLAAAASPESAGVGGGGGADE
jgi:NAD(P)-dependent dehydrogenase (short-subunit alcohol dehydrogenase family)